MRNLPFDKPGRFYKGNLHTHTTYSDGARELSDVVHAYQDRGYDFLSITDHFLPKYGFPITDASAYNNDGFITLPGAELHAPTLVNSDLWHIVGVGLPADFNHPCDGETGPELAYRAAEAGAFIGLAHPAWYTLTPYEADLVKSAHAVEVYNHTAAAHNDRGDSWYLLELLLARGRRLNAYAADDAHFGQRPDSFGGWVHVRAESLDPEMILASLKAGHYYSSQGPKINSVEISGDTIEVDCSPAVSVYLTGCGSVVEFCSGGESITSCSMSLVKFRGSYCRVTVVDDSGKRAWTNPIWLE